MSACAHAGAVRAKDAVDKAARIIVVGGGFAGLAAARTLEEQSSARVTLLEAAPAVGGRAKSAMLSDGQKVELGATWLHGSKDHPVYDLAVHYGIMSPSDLSSAEYKNFWKGSRYFRQGEVVPLEEDEERLAKHAIAVYAETVEAAEESDVETVAEALEPKLAELCRQNRGGDRDLGILRDAWHWRELLQRNIDGCDDTADSSAAGLAEYEDLGGPWGAIPGGYQTVAQRMADDLQDVRCSTAVESIGWSGEGARVGCSNGETLEADAVILTVSVGVLKERMDTMFKPHLPETKAAAIQRFGIGIVDKLFVTFQCPGDEPHSTINSYNLLWAAAVETPRGKGTSDSAVQRCITASALPGSNGAEAAWQEGIYSFRMSGSEFIKGSRRLPDSTQVSKNVQEAPSIGGQSVEASEAISPKASAVAWIAGHHAVDMELASERALLSGVATALDAFPAVELPRNFKVVRSQWGTDPCTRGSYAYLSAANRPGDVAALAAPLEVDGRPIVLFAGEATSDSHIGTTTGAFESGVREAKRLLEALALRKEYRSAKLGLA